MKAFRMHRSDDDIEAEQNAEHLGRILCWIGEAREQGKLKDCPELLRALDDYDDWAEPLLPEPITAENAPVEDGAVEWEW